METNGDFKKDSMCRNVVRIYTRADQMRSDVSTNVFRIRDSSPRFVGVRSLLFTTADTSAGEGEEDGVADELFLVETEEEEAPD